MSPQRRPGATERRITLRVDPNLLTGLLESSQSRRDGLEADLGARLVALCCAPQALDLGGVLAFATYGILIEVEPAEPATNEVENG